MENNFEATVSHLIHLVGVCIEIFGVFIIVVGIIYSTFILLHWTHGATTLRSIQNSDRSIIAARPRSLGCSRHSENHSDRDYFHQPRPSRRIGPGTHLPELD